MCQELCQDLYVYPPNISGNALRYRFDLYFIGQGRNGMPGIYSIFTVCTFTVKRALCLRVQKAGLQY